MCFIQFSMAHWKKRGIFMVENQVFGRAGGAANFYKRLFTRFFKEKISYKNES